MRGIRPSRRFEGAWKRRGCCLVAGVDEAGRGCLAGPVVAGAVILPRRVPPGIRDSKMLSPRMRSRLFAALADAGAVLSWGAAQPQEIDRLNILRASFLAMRRAVAGLPERPEALLVDGFAIPDLELPQRALIKGDARCLSIAAASIVAKVVRDRMMIDLDRLFPAFGFRKHKGYPTREHVEALRRHGPTPVHRRSFGPVREMLQGIAAG